MCRICSICSLMFFSLLCAVMVRTFNSDVHAVHYTSVLDEVINVRQMKNHGKTINRKKWPRVFCENKVSEEKYMEEKPEMWKTLWQSKIG